MPKHILCQYYDINNIIGTIQSIMKFYKNPSNFEFP